MLMTQIAEDFDRYLDRVVRRLVERVAQEQRDDVWRGNGPPDVDDDDRLDLLTKIKMGALLRDAVDEHMHDLIVYGSDRKLALLNSTLDSTPGVRPTWKEIGHALGISAQAAHRKYGRAVSARSGELTSTLSDRWPAASFGSIVRHGWPYFGLTRTLNAAAYCAPVSTVWAGQQWNGQVAGARDTVTDLMLRAWPAGMARPTSGHAIGRSGRSRHHRGNAFRHRELDVPVHLPATDDDPFPPGIHPWIRSGFRLSSIVISRGLRQGVSYAESTTTRLRRPVSGSCTQPSGGQ